MRLFNTASLSRNTFTLISREILTERLSFIIITLLSLICFFLAFSIPDSLFGGKTILTEANDWSGVQRLENGFMILPQAPNPSIAQVNLPVKANTNYKIEVESRCDSKVNFFIDFNGPNYDSGDQETMFECGVTNEHHLINSGSPPADVAARIFFLSEHTSISILKIKITKLSKYSNYLKIAVMSAPLFLVSLLFLYTKKVPFGRRDFSSAWYLIDLYPICGSSPIRKFFGQPVVYSNCPIYFKGR